MANIKYLVGDEDSPRNVLLDVANNSDEYSMVVLVGLKKDDTIVIGHSTGDLLEKTELMTLATTHFVETMKDG